MNRPMSESIMKSAVAAPWRGFAVVVTALAACMGQPYEVCLDTGRTCGPGYVCSPSGGVCVALNSCGNGRVDPDEHCDDGNRVSGDGCSSDCQSTEGCGNDTRDIYEACDDGNLNDGDGCSATCEIESCGNGIINEPYEVCDDGNHINGDRCSADCASDETCGNGYIDWWDGEWCDDGNTDNGDACPWDCKSSNCGDGALQVGEVCDDGNTMDGDGCSSACLQERCGDGVINHTSEVCDDGNTTSGDGCRADCLSDETCGNGITDLGEECDDGNSTNADCCKNDCTFSGIIVINSPITSRDPFGSLALDGRANPHGYWITELTKRGIRYQLEVANGELLGRAADGHTLRGGQLVGSSIGLGRGRDSHWGEIVIEAVDRYEPYGGVEGGGFAGYAMSYREFARADRANRPLCPGISDSSRDAGLASAVVMGAYDDSSRAAIAGEESGWVNFACEGDALFKMKRMGHAPDGLTCSQNTSVPRRTATLRMITASYCDGRSFTERGVRYGFQRREHDGSQAQGDTRMEIEALWDEHGALCLDEPRLAQRVDVEAICGPIPRCSAMYSGDETWLDHLLRDGRYEWMSYRRP